jgi:hypothetical protein
MADAGRARVARLFDKQLSLQRVEQLLAQAVSTRSPAEPASAPRSVV